MAQILLISAKSVSAGDNREVGDVVGIYADDHVFSAHELEIFEIVRVRDTSREALQVTANIVEPEVREATRARTVEWTLDEPEQRQVWRDSGGNYLEIKEPPRLALRWNARDEKLEENYSRHAANLETTLISADSEVVREG